MEPRHHPDYTTVKPLPVPTAPKGNGSIYQPGFEVVLYEDRKARRIGDIITIVLLEQTQASKNATTDSAKKNEASAAIPSRYGTDIDLSIDRTFAGSGATAQSNKLTGDVTVTVVEVLPNRNLLVRGEKRIGINDGFEYIRISGIVRPEDLSPNNTVSSAKVADATIQYVGDGPGSESTRMGWLSRLFVHSWFPY